MKEKIETEMQLKQLFYHFTRILPFWDISLKSINKKPKKGLHFQWTIDLKFPKG